MNLKQYSDILGVPHQGFHEARLFGLARNDLVGTFIIAIIISCLWELCVVKVFAILFILGQLFHWAFGVNTAFLRLLKTRVLRSFQALF